MLGRLQGGDGVLLVDGLRFLFILFLTSFFYRLAFCLTFLLLHWPLWVHSISVEYQSYFTFSTVHACL